MAKRKRTVINGYSVRDLEGRIEWRVFRWGVTYAGKGYIATFYTRADALHYRDTMNAETRKP